MNKRIDELINRGLERLMSESRDALAQEDTAYQSHCANADQLERKYKMLDLTKEQRKLIHEYIASLSAVSHRYADIAYICGIRDTVSMLASLGLIQGVEVKE